MSIYYHVKGGIDMQDTVKIILDVLVILGDIAVIVLIAKKMSNGNNKEEK